jgi:hypothetical protein
VIGLLSKPADSFDALVLWLAIGGAGALLFFLAACLEDLIPLRWADRLLTAGRPDDLHASSPDPHPCPTGGERPGPTAPVGPGPQPGTHDRRSQGRVGADEGAAGLRGGPAAPATTPHGWQGR